MKDKILIAVGAAVLLLVIFAFPAFLVPNAMDDVPERAMIKAITNYQSAVNVAQDVFARHRTPPAGGRLASLPVDTRAWIELLNPMGRKAPGGGLAFLPAANPDTGAIGISGNETRVIVTLPAYRALVATETIISMSEGDEFE